MAMKIEIPVVTIRELVSKYKDSGQNGVVAFAGKLNVRPAYQREFVYEPEDRNRVNQSVYNGLPLNSMYWAKNPDGTFEVIDGQQRIISICQFITNNDGHGNPIAINFNGKNNQTFKGLSLEKQKEILDYQLQVYVCIGTDDEKLDWFHTINIAGKQMTEQELLNANYTGQWLTNAKACFSKKSNNIAINYAFYNNNEKDTLLSVTSEAANRQELLALVLKWISNYNSEEYAEPKDYMAKHRNDNNADELWAYYISVIDWVKGLFPNYRKEMKGVEWGVLYNKYHTNKYDVNVIEDELSRLFNIYDEDPDGLNKGGFYEYVLSGNKNLIWKRLFSQKQQRQAWINQSKKCAICGKCFDVKDMEAHHKIAYGDGGETVVNNCMMLCHDCHADITARQNSHKR